MSSEFSAEPLLPAEQTVPRARAHRHLAPRTAIASVVSLLVGVLAGSSLTGRGAQLPVIGDVPRAAQPHDASGFVPYQPKLDRTGIPDLSDVLPKNGSRVRWGIAGPGRISHDFAAALVAMNASVVAVAAGSLPGALARAEAFAAVYEIPRAYGNYAALAADPRVDIVYVGSTNNAHYSTAKLLLEAGKHVLLEKPATIGIREFDELAALAHKQGLLLLTNYWTRWFPALRWARAVIASGQLGAVVHVAGDMAFQAMLQRTPHADRFARADLGGGAMLDMGCYLVQFVVLFLPRMGSGADDFAVKAVGAAQAGVDLDVAFTLSTSNATASLGTSLKRASDFALEIYCEHGKVTIASPANCPTEATFTRYADARQAAKLPLPCCGQPTEEVRSFSHALPRYPSKLESNRAYPNGMGFVYVASAVERCLYLGGCVELDELTMAEQRLIVQLTGAVHSQLGLYQGVTGM